MTTTLAGRTNRFLFSSEKQEFYMKKRGVVVDVQSKKKEDLSEGAGVVINKHGHVLTCNHILEEDYEHLKIGMFNEELKAARKLGADLAVVKLGNFYDNYEYCKLADNQVLNLGMEVLTISHMEGLRFSFDSSHLAHGFNREVADRRIAEILLECDLGSHEFLEMHDVDAPVLQICGLSTCFGSSGTVVRMCFMACMDGGDMSSFPITYAIGFPTLKDFVLKHSAQKLRVVNHKRLMKLLKFRAFGQGMVKQKLRMAEILLWLMLEHLCLTMPCPPCPEALSFNSFINLLCFTTLKLLSHVLDK